MIIIDRGQKQNLHGKENIMIDEEDQIRFLRLKLAETVDPITQQYILKQLAVLEAEETVKEQTLLVE